VPVNVADRDRESPRSRQLTASVPIRKASRRAQERYPFPTLGNGCLEHLHGQLSEKAKPNNGDHIPSLTAGSTNTMQSNRTQSVNAASSKVTPDSEGNLASSRREHKRIRHGPHNQLQHRLRDHQPGCRLIPFPTPTTVPALLVAEAPGWSRRVRTAAIAEKRPSRPAC